MIADQVLNLAARMALRAWSPLQAHAVMMRLGRLFPSHSGREDVRHAASALGGRGTCLSRSLALAARTPEAVVVIGVDRDDDAGLRAHAWLELDGAPLHAWDRAGREIARLGPALASGQVG